jgi:hypothetical protein
MIGGFAGSNQCQIANLSQGRRNGVQCAQDRQARQALGRAGAGPSSGRFCVWPSQRGKGLGEGACARGIFGRNENQPQLPSKSLGRRNNSAPRPSLEFCRRGISTGLYRKTTSLRRGVLRRRPPALYTVVLKGSTLQGSSPP